MVLSKIPFNRFDKYLLIVYTIGMKTIKVVAAIIKRDKNIIIAQRLKGDLAGRWEFPGGKIEPNETPEQALIREIKEELEITITIDSFLMKAEWDYPTFHLDMDCFICHTADSIEYLNDHSAIKWLPIDTTEAIAWCPADQQIFIKLKTSSK